MTTATVATSLVQGPDSNAIALGVASGSVFVCFQALPDGDWTGWGPLAAAPVRLLSTAVAGYQGDALTAVAVGLDDGNLYSIDSPTGQGWSASWDSRGHPAATNLGAGCAVAASGNTIVVAVAVGVDGRLWAISRATGQPWSRWTDLGAPTDVRLRGTCGITTLSSGTMLAAAVGEDGQLHTVTGAPATGWSAWQRIGRPASTSLSGAVAVAPTTQEATAFVVGTDGSGYLVPVGTAPGQFTAVGHPPTARLRVDRTGTAGLLPEPMGGLTVLASAEDDLAYSLDTSSGAWSPLAEPGGELPLRSVTGETEELMYVACVAAPARTGQAVSRRAGSTTCGPQLGLGTVAASDTVSLDVPVGAAFLVAAVQDSEGMPVPGVGLTVVNPAGSTTDTPSPPNSVGTVVEMADGLVTSMLVALPDDGVWTFTVQGATDGDNDLQVTLTTLPAFAVQTTIEATLQEMCASAGSDQALPTGFSWGCAACRFGGYAGATLIAAAIVGGVVLLPESAVVLWLASLIGVSQKDALAFITTLAKQGITSVPAIVNSICKKLGSCS